MSPLERWRNYFSLENTFIPIDTDELDLICCDTTTRTIGHIGIELHNCVFNSHDLQLLRQSIPTVQGMKVQVNFNAELLNCIWVKNPVTQEYLQVINTDPATNDLNSAQTAKLSEMRRQASSTNATLSSQEARERMIALTAPFMRAKTQTERRRAFKLLGIIADGDLDQKASSQKAKAAEMRRRSTPKLERDTKPTAILPPPTAAARQHSAALLEDEPPPIFAIVSRQVIPLDLPFGTGEQP